MQITDIGLSETSQMELNEAVNSLLESAGLDLNTVLAPEGLVSATSAPAMTVDQQRCDQP